jgi:hypothetical protein
MHQPNREASCPDLASRQRGRPNRGYIERGAYTSFASGTASYRNPWPVREPGNDCLSRRGGSN